MTQTFPRTGFVRLSAIIGNPKANPPIPPFLQISKSAWYEGVHAGIYPAPIVLGPRTSVYNAEDVWAVFEQRRRG